MLREGAFKHLYMNAETVQWFLIYSKLTISELSECSNRCCGLKLRVFCRLGLVNGVLKYQNGIAGP